MPVAVAKTLLDNAYAKKNSIKKEIWDKADSYTKDTIAMIPIAAITDLV